MRWPPRSGVLRAKQRANLSFFIFIIFFVVFGMIMFTELLRVDLRGLPMKSHYDSQVSRRNICCNNCLDFVARELFSMTVFVCLNRDRPSQFA